MPQDAFGREIDYLRLSLTDRCNLRCVYCMPQGYLPFLPREQCLTAGELERVARAAAAVGFRKIRLTGGEPTLRADVVDIVRRLRRIDGIGEIGMTTNGVLLKELARPLVDAGLSRVNIHLDAVGEAALVRVMRFARRDAIWRGIEAAESAGLLPIKINAVIVRDLNDREVVELARLTVDRPWHVRFIEMMPFGTGSCARVATERYVSNEVTRARIAETLGRLERLPPRDDSEESVNYRLPGARGVVGFISPVSAPYCGSCNRMRVTADGKLHLCLLHDDEIDLRPTLRNGAQPGDLERLILRGVAHKPIGHRLSEGVFTELRIMHQIGG